jgi:uncharacterized protein
MKIAWLLPLCLAFTLTACDRDPFERNGKLALTETSGVVVEPNEEGIRTLAWEDLIPSELQLAPQVITAYDAGIINDDDPRIVAWRKQMAEPIQPPNLTLAGKRIRLPGFVVPIEMESNQVTHEFLLVPYHGACIHVPPPPSNQTVYVKSANADGYRLRQLFDPVWVTGILTIETVNSDVAVAGYTLLAELVEDY